MTIRSPLPPKLVRFTGAQVARSSTFAVRTLTFGGKKYPTFTLFMSIMTEQTRLLLVSRQFSLFATMGSFDCEPLDQVKRWQIKAVTREIRLIARVQADFNPDLRTPSIPAEHAISAETDSKRPNRQRRTGSEKPELGPYDLSFDEDEEGGEVRQPRECFQKKPPVVIGKPRPIPKQTKLTRRPLSSATPCRK